MCFLCSRIEVVKLIIGLGNPGEEYLATRHNVGSAVVDRLERKGWQKSKSGLLLYSWFSPTVELVRTSTFMNKSGDAVKFIVSKDKVDPKNLYIVHDDLDIKLGDYKIQFGKGPKDHNGLNDIYDKLGTDQFWHVRVGIENRDEENKIPGEKYVLQDFSDEESLVIDKVINEVCKKLVMS